MNMKMVISQFIMVFTVISLKAQEPTENLSQMERVVKIHDAIMEKDMGKTVYYIGQLENKIKAEGSSAAYEKAIEDLKLANKAMADWMQSFGSRFDADEMYKGKPLTEQKKEWLDEEERKLFEMKGQLESSIEAAAKVLGKE